MTKLLIVDDEPYTVQMLETFLQLHGFETVGAYCGEDGLVMVKVERPEILILDLMLPDIEGFEVCRRIRSFPDSAALPVLILSARADAESKERALAAGASAYMVKPARFPVLLETLQRLLAASVKPAELPAGTSQASAGHPTPPGESAEAVKPAAQPAEAPQISADNPPVPAAKSDQADHPTI